MTEFVTRTVPFEATRASDDGLTLEGYAAVFDSPTVIEDWSGRFAERIKKGAFAKTIQERTVLQFDHGHHPLIGSIPLGDITTLREDDKGLFVRARLSDNWLVEPVRDAIRSGAVNGMSFRFRVIHDESEEGAEWAEELGAEKGVTLLEVAMPELGPVVFPAYEDTEVGVRADDADNLLATRMVDRLHEQQVSGTDEGAAPKGTPESAAEEKSTDEPPPGHSTDTDPTEGRDNDSTEEVRNMATMTVEERAARQDEIRSRLEALANEYEGETMTDEAREEWDELNDEFDRHGVAIVETEERRARVAELADDERSTDAPRDNKGRRKSVNIGNTGTANVWDLVEARREAMSKARTTDEIADVYRDRALRALEQARFDGDDVEDKRGQVEKLLYTAENKAGDLARKILATGSPTYHRAYGKAVSSLSTDGLTEEEKRALSVGTDTAGGFAVPFDLDPSVILTNDGSLNPLRQVSRVEQTVSKTWQGLSSAGITVTRSAEASESDDDAPTFAQPDVTPTRVDGFVPFSIELDQDWPALRSQITMLLADAKDQEEASSFATGDGVDPNPEGLETGLVAAGDVHDVGTTGAVASSDLFAMEEAVGPRFRARGSWVASKGFYNDVRQLSSASDGGDLWVRLAAGQPNELIGYPARELSTLASPAAVDTASAVFGDFATGFLIVDRVGMFTELVPHVFGANGRPTGQRGIVTYWRNSSLVIVPEALVALTDDGV